MLDGLAGFCREQMAEHGSPSVSVAVVWQGAIVADACGLADVAQCQAATSATPYLLASVTKPITATAVCIAADRGMLNLDNPVEGYLDVVLPRVAGITGKPTVRQVLQHRAGLDVFYDFNYADSTAPVPALEQTVSRYATLIREPGTHWEYCNLGYGILDLVLAKVTGGDPRDFVQDEVFAPLNLMTCHIGPSYPDEAVAAQRYSAAGKRYPTYDTSHRGASLAWGSATDVAKFGLAHPTLLSPDVAAAMHTALPAHGAGYGLGWMIPAGAPRILYHTGGMGGVSSLLAVAPDLELSVCVLANKTSVPVRAIGNYVLSELVPGFVALPTPSVESPQVIPSGSWQGHIETHAGRIPLGLIIDADQTIEVRLDDEIVAGVLDAWPGWDLRVLVPLQLPTPAARLNSPEFTLNASLDNGDLIGVARTRKPEEGDGWLGNCLGYVFRLSRMR